MGSGGVTGLVIVTIDEPFDYNPKRIATNVKSKDLTLYISAKEKHRLSAGVFLSAFLDLLSGLLIVFGRGCLFRHYRLNNGGDDGFVVRWHRRVLIHHMIGGYE